MGLIIIDDLDELETRSFWFITKQYKGIDYFLKKYKENVNGAYWTNNFHLAAGYLNEKHATQIKDAFFDDQEEVTIVEYKI